MLSQLEYMNPKQAATLLGVNAAKVLAWIHAGELSAADVSTHRGVGRPRWRIKRADLDLFLSGRSTTPPPKPKRKPRRESSVIEFY